MDDKTPIVSDKTLESTPPIQQEVPIVNKPKSKRIIFIITGIIVFLILAGSAAGFYLFKNQTPERIACTMEAKVCPDGSSVGRSGPKCEFSACPTPNQSMIFSECKNVSGDFRLIEGNNWAGNATISGKIITLNERFYNSTFSPIYILVAQKDSNPPAFFDYYQGEISHGNTVNKTDNNTLLFKLGELKDGKTLSSDASINQVTRTQIESSLGTNNSITLNLKIAVPPGRDAATNSSFACEIDKSQNEQVSTPTPTTNPNLECSTNADCKSDEWCADAPGVKPPKKGICLQNPR